ncbi:MAG: ABC-F family ATP-binding cassette domain-containing protein [Chloroflexi bacterium]|nr:ABC-F family ATP-binding cassette domain-containing protein [Chloroflexota bacterium]
MSVLSVQALAKRYGERLVFSGVSFRLAHGDRVGLVGPNGTGKSTLLRIAAGRDEADEGNVAVARGTRIGLLEQELLADVPGTAEEHARGAAAHIRDLEAEMRALELRLAGGDAEVLERYADVQHQFEHAGGYDFDSTVKRVLDGLGLTSLATREVGALSGGERTRLGLARLLLDDPDLMLLDEPTNHLDIAALEWLERFLVERRATFLVVGHDRWFLDRVTSRTLSFERGTVVEYRGSYSHYARQRADRDAALTKAAERQAEEIARTEEFIRKYGAGHRSKEARGRGKTLARVERIQAPERLARHGWRLDAAHMPGDAVVKTTALVVGHRRDAPVVRTPPLRIARGARVAVVGPNGAGKTTLVRTLIGDLPAIDGYVASAPSARVAYLAQTQQDLGGGTVLDALREASGLQEQAARDLLARFLFRGEDVFKDIAVLSGGERTRLALACLAAREANLLVLDEPTNHLDVAAREALESVLLTFEGSLLFVSHDRYLIDKLATEVWLVERGELKKHEGNWTSLRAARLGGGDVASGVPDPGARSVAPARPLGQMSPERARVARRLGSAPSRRIASPPRPRRRLASGEREIQALEQRIKEMEERIKQLEERLAEVARTGNYMETRRVGEEHATLEQALRALYEEWAARSE